MIFKEDKTKNNNISKNSNLFSVSINSYKEIYFERKCDIYYNIQITDNNLKKSWEIEKTIDNFQNLYEKIFILHPYIPMIPKKTLFKIIQNQKEIIKRWSYMVNYLFIIRK